jgi:hypothetical protein
MSRGYGSPIREGERWNWQPRITLTHSPGLSPMG